MLLEIKDLSKQFGGVTALSDVEIKVAEGEILGLIGPNGAGKTTLFNVITGFIRPEKGQIQFKGKNITHQPPDSICAQGICRTFQICKPFSGMTVLQNVMIGSFSRTRDSKLAEEMAHSTLQVIGMEAKENELAKNLTLSDRKRMELARALATQPKILLLDELMCGLNPTEVLQTVGLFEKIHRTGVTLLVIEHIMAAIMHISTRIAVLHHGMMIAQGTPTEIAEDKRVIEAYLGERYLVA